MYGLLVGIKEQAVLIEKHCFGDCGKITIGAAIDHQYGEIALCKYPPSECPYFDKQMLEPLGTISDGEQIILRKLKG